MDQFFKELKNVRKGDEFHQKVHERTFGELLDYRKHLRYEYPSFEEKEIKGDTSIENFYRLWKKYAKMDVIKVNGFKLQSDIVGYLAELVMAHPDHNNFNPDKEKIENIPDFIVADYMIQIVDHVSGWEGKEVGMEWREHITFDVVKKEMVDYVIGLSPVNMDRSQIILEDWFDHSISDSNPLSYIIEMIQDAWEDDESSWYNKGN